MHISYHDYGLVIKMKYNYQYVIIIIYDCFLWCFGLFNCVPVIPHVIMILCWKRHIVRCDSALGLTQSKQMSL